MREQESYQIFEDADARRELYQITKAVASYCHNEAITNLVLLDRQARPAYRGIVEYWNRAYPKESKPAIYFLNPLGVMPSARATAVDLRIPTYEAAVAVLQGIFGGEDYPQDEINKVRTQREIDSEFAQTYHRLLQEKEAPTLVFDTCTHSGSTLTPVVAALRRAGLIDVRVGVAADEHTQSRVPVDFVALPHRPIFGCIPFGYDNSVRKTFGTSHSLRRELAPEHYRDIKQVRTEIRQIVREQATKE